MSADTLGKYCEACQAFPIIGYCRLAGCPNVPASGEKTLIERLRFHGRHASESEVECGIRKYSEREEAADALSDRDARIAALEEGLREIVAKARECEAFDAENVAALDDNPEAAEGANFTVRHHWTSRAKVTKSMADWFDNRARALLTPTGTEIKDE